MSAFVLAAALTVGLQAPAMASHKSPENAVNNFWDHLQFGQPHAAINEFRPMCRTPKIEKAFTELSHQLVSILQKYNDTYLFVGEYHERVSGSHAVVTYSVKLKVFNVVNKDVEYVHSQHWVRSGDKWYLDCQHFGV